MISGGVRGEAWAGTRRFRAPALACAVTLLVLLVPTAGGGGMARAASAPRAVLTLDDGYGCDHRIIEFLSSQGIQATAFVIGAWAQNNPSLLREMDSLGWDICNHTQNHPWLTKIPDAQIAAELNACQSVIGSMTGQYLPVFRPPGGFIDARVMNVAASLGYAPVMWDFDSMDALNTSIPVQERVDRMVGAAGDGDIFLFHFGGRNTYELVTGVVRGLQQRGFCFITLSELYGWKDQIRGGDSGPGIADAAVRHYFAEGTTRPGFEEWILVFNPGAEAATLRVRFHSSREAVLKEYSLPPRGRLSISVNREVPWQEDLAAVLESSLPVVAERTLYFSRGRGFGGGSLSRGASDASSTHYFPEGTVRPGFEEYLALFNPSAVAEARAEVEFHAAGREAGRAVLDVPPLTRVTACINDLVEGGDISMLVRSAVPLVAERSEYFAYNDVRTGSLCSPGAPAPRGEWFFAEGTTRSFFDGYLTLFNPCRYATWLKVRLIASDGSVREEALGVGAGERKTLYLNAYLPADIDYAVRVSSLLPVTAERVTYFQSHNAMGGYCSGGVPEPRDRWFFPEGCTAQGFQEWLALFNPQTEEQVVEVAYVCGGGEEVERSYLLPPEGRISVDVSAEVGRRDEVSIEVSSRAGVVAERSLYFTRGGP